MPQVTRLLDETFRCGIGQSVVTDYPLVFAAGNRQNVRLIDINGKVASHVAFVPREIVHDGCRITAGTLGSVATNPQYRGQGLAGALIDDALSKMQHGGCDIALLWTKIPDYFHAAGWVPTASNGWAYTLHRHEADRFTLNHHVRAMSPDTDLDAILALHERLPRRVARSRTQCHALLTLPKVSVLVAEEGNRPVAYVVAAHGYNKYGVLEWAGDDSAFESLLAGVARTLGDELPVLVARHDEPAIGLLSQRLESPPKPMEQVTPSGVQMVRVLNPGVRSRIASEPIELFISPLDFV